MDGTCGWDLWVGPVDRTCGWDLWVGPVDGMCGWGLWVGPVGGTCGWDQWVELLADQCVPLPRAACGRAGRGNGAAAGPSNARAKGHSRNWLQPN